MAEKIKSEIEIEVKTWGSWNLKELGWQPVDADIKTVCERRTRYSILFFTLKFLVNQLFTLDSVDFHDSIIIMANPTESFNPWLAWQITTRETPLEKKTVVKLF